MRRRYRYGTALVVIVLPPVAARTSAGSGEPAARPATWSGA